MEPDHKGVPILLRQYLKLGARLVGFNVDPHFNDAMGREQATAYLSHPR